jgi:hypothetical protein
LADLTSDKAFTVSVLTTTTAISSGTEHGCGCNENLENYQSAQHVSHIACDITLFCMGFFGCQRGDDLWEVQSWDEIAIARID